MQVTLAAARCMAPALLTFMVSGCSSPAAQSRSDPAAQTAAVPARTDQIEILTGTTSRVITLEEFVALQEIENLGPVDPADKIICRKEKPVGTHFRSYRCFTEAQLRKYTRASQDWLRAAQYWQQSKQR